MLKIIRFVRPLGERAKGMGLDGRVGFMRAFENQ